MTLQELSQAVSELLTQLPANTPVAACVNVEATVELTKISVGGVTKVVVIEKAVG